MFEHPIVGQCPETFAELAGMFGALPGEDFHSFWGPTGENPTSFSNGSLRAATEPTPCHARAFTEREAVILHWAGIQAELTRPGVLYRRDPPEMDFYDQKRFALHPKGDAVDRDTNKPSVIVGVTRYYRITQRFYVSEKPRLTPAQLAAHILRLSRKRAEDEHRRAQYLVDEGNRSAEFWASDDGHAEIARICTLGQFAEPVAVTTAGP